MKYKTTIKITSEARNKNEAIDIVDDYLAGNIRSGVDMRCSTRPDCNSVKITTAVVVSLIAIVAVLLPTQLKAPNGVSGNTSAVSAVQPPLKTDKRDADFKKKWEDRQSKEVLEYIKR